MSVTAELWECEYCAFGFDARHTLEDGTYSCPVCEAAELRAEVERLRNENRALRHGFMRLTEQRDQAVDWIGVVTAELVAAGGRSGDRTVALENLRALIRERDRLPGPGHRPGRAEADDEGES